MPRSSAAPRPAAAALPAGTAPLYLRLQHALRMRLAAGEWRAGERIPTIRELGETYGVSHITVDQALDVLARDGLVRRWQGKGIFVAEPGPDQSPAPLLSFTEQILRRGQQPSSRTLRLERLGASEAVAARLGLEPGQPVVLLERLRLADGLPVGLQQAFLPERRVPGLVEQTAPIDSLYRLLAESYGLFPSQATERYVPVQLTRQQARLLEARVGAAAFGVERCTSDQHRQPLEYVQAVLRGDRYQVVLELTRR